MSMSKFAILLGLILLMTVPIGLVQAQGTPKGTAVISDSQGLSNRITYSITGVTPPGEGKALEGWLVSDDGAKKLSTGVMTIGRDGSISYSFTSPSGENFIKAYSRVVITIEPVPDAAPLEPSATKAFEDAIPLAAMEHIRHLLVNWPPTSAKGIQTNLKEQLDLAIEHADLATRAPDLDTLRLHTHHVINIIEGTAGPNFAVSFGNPGDGQGVLLHAQDRKHAGFAAAQAPSDASINDHAKAVESAGKNAETWATEARDNALNVLTQPSLTNSRTLLSTVRGRLDAARNGIAATGMGGAQQAYVQAQLMATYLQPARGAGGVAPPPAATTGVIGLPKVGDTVIPVVARFALLASIGLLATGGFMLYRERRSRKKV